MKAESGFLLRSLLENSNDARILLGMTYTEADGSQTMLVTVGRLYGQEQALVSVGRVQHARQVVSLSRAVPCKAPQY
eukprot:5153822-Pleurochrysis_carterae.AAC.1